MTRFVITRFIQAAVTLLAVSFIIFMLGRVTGNPVDMLLPMEATLEMREREIHRLGLDRPILYQYGVFLKGAVRGDFGESLRTKKPVVELVRARVGNSLKLATVAMAITILIAMPLGVIAAVNRGRIWDRGALLIALLGMSLPTFWTGAMGIIIFGVVLGLLPVSGMGDWRNYVLPAATMGWFSSAGLLRLLRSSMLEVLDSEYVKLARTKGVSERGVVYRHALRNALIPVVTFIGLMYGIIIGAGVTTEVVFSWPGMGRLTYEAILWRDFPLLQFTVLVWAALVIFINLVVDLLYVVLDPRVRL